MKVALSYFKNDQYHIYSQNDEFEPDLASLVLSFGSKKLIGQPEFYHSLKEKYPKANIALCSTSGEIYGDMVRDNTVSITAVYFDKVPIKALNVNINDYKNSSFDAGKDLALKIDDHDLSYVMILSDGALINGSKLLQGIVSVLNNDIPITGGLAGDGTDFNSTLVGLNAVPEQGNITALCFYGKQLKISHGYMGGWETFGIERTITKSMDNQLFEIDNKNALDMYKDYLGTYATELPGSALLFPLSVKLSKDHDPVVRTILSIDEKKKSMTFAGDVPEGAKTRFMRANFDRLVLAASNAAHNTINQNQIAQPKLALLISCVGRKIILSSRIEEEVEAIKEVFGPQTFITGFYSYGEISPGSTGKQCELHNQTMTITTLHE